eukprot:1368839-Pleurochrysis_carterae.AAC.4
MVYAELGGASANAQGFAVTMKHTGPSGVVVKRLKAVMHRPQDTAAAKAETELKAARAEALRRQRKAATLRTQVGTFDRDAETGRKAFEWKAAADYAREAQTRLNGEKSARNAAVAETKKENELLKVAAVKLRAAEQKCRAAESELATQHIAGAKLIQSNKALESKLSAQKESMSKLQEKLEPLDSLRRMLSLMVKEGAELQAPLDEERGWAKALHEQMADAQRKIDVLEAQLEEAQMVEDSDDEVDDKPVGGRPKGHAGRDIIKATWGSMARRTRYMKVARDADDIVSHLQVGGCNNWLPLAFISALKKLGLWEELLASRVIADLKFNFALHLRNVLSAEWGVPLALFIKAELSPSDSDYLKLRLALCKKYNPVTMLWEKRVWYFCPVTERSIYLPKPLVARSAWLGEWRQQYVEKFGLQVNEDGRVCERGLVATAQLMIARDADALLPASATSKWWLTFGIDYTTISWKRGFTHAALSLGARYRQGRRMQTELKVMTLAVGQCHDDNGGLRLMLTDTTAAKGGGFNSLASDIAQLYHNKKLQRKVWLVDCGVRCCLDLAAAHGLRGSRGKTACFCACCASDKRSHPGDGKLADLPDGDGVAAWLQARDVLRSECSWSKEILSYSLLHDAAHAPPPDWDPEADGAWGCRHCGQNVFTDWASFEEAKARLAAMREAADGGNEDVAKEYLSCMKVHADGHFDQLLYQPPVVEAGADIFIVDPLHDLELNIAKTCFKYAFLDQMDERARSKAFEYFASIGIYFDLRAKKQRNPENKWMSAADVDDYVLGPERDVKSKSPGLAMNTHVLNEIIFATSTVVDNDATPAAAAMAPPAPTTTASSALPARRGGRKGRQAAPRGGFSTSMLDAEDTTAAEEPSGNDLQDNLDELDGFEAADSATVLRYLSTRYGNKAENAAANLQLYESFGKLFAAWRDEWPQDTPEYRAERALRFARAGVPEAHTNIHV